MLVAEGQKVLDEMMEGRPGWKRVGEDGEVRWDGPKGLWTTTDLRDKKEPGLWTFSLWLEPVKGAESLCWTSLMPEDMLFLLDLMERALDQGWVEPVEMDREVSMAVTDR